MSNLNDGKVEFKITRVEPTSYSLNFPDNYEYSKEKFKIRSKVTIKIDIDLESNNLTYFLSFQLSSRRRDTGEEETDLFDIKSTTVFVIQNLSEHIKVNEDKDEDDLNKDFLFKFLEIAIGHTRGMQSVILKGTPIAKFLISSPDMETINLKINAK